ncbi:MAG: ATP-binding protein [Bacilli bacterium]|nr:ATP-binding protein [Bacilli bacterium]
MFGLKANVTLKLASFATDEKMTFLDLKEYKDNIYNLVNAAIEYVSTKINWRVEIGQRKRIEIPEIPVRALREMIINAFAHANYERSPEIEINIHPNKIAIFNPGTFPDDLIPQDFIDKNISSIKRNPLILDVLFRCKDVEKSGTGFRGMNELCKDEKIRLDYDKTPYGFYFTFYRTKSGSNKPFEQNPLSIEEEKVLLILNSNPKITKEEIAFFNI